MRGIFYRFIRSLIVIAYLKKAAAFGLMAYFLLLTTGMFVCIVHCAAAKLVEQADNHAKINGADKDDDDDCKHNDNCDCCKKHDNFVIKENIKPAYNSQAFCDLIFVYPKFAPLLNLPEYIVYNSYWPDCHAPPAKSGKFISIIQRSLQI